MGFGLGRITTIRIANGESLVYSAMAIIFGKEEVPTHEARDCAGGRG
jgi:hypothetical protein